MKILAIETSCDETAIAILECNGDTRKNEVVFDVLSNVVLSQAALHAEYGGVFPSLAKREHSRNLVPVLKQALEQAHKISDFQFSIFKKIPHTKSLDARRSTLNALFAREPELLAQFLEYIPTIQKPPIDAIAVTYGPGLEPALWVGINFAKALALVWNLPIIPVNHMEGHLVASLLAQNNAERTQKYAEKNGAAPSIQHTIYDIQKIDFPTIALLVSGGHTELVLSRGWLRYEIVGETRDDAAGEAFDKVARMLELPYPGGPHIAEQARQYEQAHADDTRTNAEKLLRRSASVPHSSAIHFPRPMIDSGDFDFSFSGLKTAVLYALKGRERTPELVREFAHEFQEAVVEVLVTKTISAAQEHRARAVLLGGGVSANTRLKEALAEAVAKNMPDAQFQAAPRELTGDNAVMIGAAAYLRQIVAAREYSVSDIRAEGTVRIGSILIS